ncbi:MAG: hypothetical protein ABIA12_01950 [Candidatus Aenigmatarchaeota archaeon]
MEIDKKKLKNIFPISASSKFAFLNYKKNKARVKSLKRLCENSDISYDGMEDSSIVSINDGIKFPIRLDVPDFAKLIAAAENEGHLETGKYLFEYYNKDLILHKIVRMCIFKMFGKITNFPKLRGNALRTYSYGTVTRALFKAGVAVGDKPLANPKLSYIIKDNPQFAKYYFSQTLAEEACTSFRFKKRMYLSLSIKYGRSVDVTEILTKNFKKQLENEQVPFKKLPANVQDAIKKKPPLIIKEEKELLESVGISCYLRPAFVYKIKKRGCVRTHWTLVIEKTKSVELFYKNFRLITDVEDTPIKVKEFSEKFRIWKEYKGRKLDENEIMLIKNASDEWSKIKKGGVPAT